MTLSAATDSALTARNGRVLAWAGHAARIALGLVFALAGLLKIVDVAEFARQTATYGIVGPGAAAVAAPALIALELALAAALLAGYRTRLAAIATGLLLVIFIGLEAWGLSRGRTETCGCFGAYVQRTPLEVILEDILFLGLAVLTVVGLGGWVARRRGRSAAVVAFVAFLALGLAVASPHLPIDPWVTSLRIGASVEDLGLAARIPPEVRENGLVAILDLTDPAAREAAADLDRIAGTEGAPRVIGLTPSNEEQHAAFLWGTYPAFEIVVTDPPVLKRLYRRLPLYFVLHGGKVTAVFRDPRPPGPDLLSSGAS